VLVGFSQSNNQIIQNYLKILPRTTLSNADFNDWGIQSEVGTTTLNRELLCGAALSRNRDFSSF
jgi:hypothetical protein